MSLTFEEFHAQALPVISFADYDDLSFWGNGLGGESGEFVEAGLRYMLAMSRLQNTAKKIERDGETAELQEAARVEAGDALFYLRQLLERCGLTMEDAGWACIEKLSRLRAERTSNA